MYRNPIEYDRMARLAISVLVDYGIKEFPLDMDCLCKKMNINLIPYSAYDGREQALLALSKDGFNTKRPLVIMQQYFSTINMEMLLQKELARQKGMNLSIFWKMIQMIWKMIYQNILVSI